MTRHAFDWISWVLIAMLASTVLTGCSSGKIHVDNISGLINHVTDRHDVYVEADESLNDLERETYLRSSRILREVIYEAQHQPSSP